MNTENKGREPICIFKPTDEHLRKAKESLEEIRKIIKEKNIPYMSAEQVSELLKDRDKNEE